MQNQIVRQEHDANRTSACGLRKSCNVHDTQVAEAGAHPQVHTDPNHGDHNQQLGTAYATEHQTH